VREIIDILLEDGRATPERIAVMTGLDADVVREKIAGWERDGVIRRYKAVVDLERLRQVTGAEVVTALIDVSVSPERGAGFDGVAGRIAQFPEVRSVHLVSGGQDLRCVVAGANMHEIGDFVARKLATIDRVTATATHFVMKAYKDDGELLIEGPGDYLLTVAP
jgi:DNA-binding Lrp family transcriptional regulator